MARDPDPEKGEGGNSRTSIESIAPVADHEKPNLRRTESGATGVPDPNYEEVAELDAGHMKDLERIHVSIACPKVELISDSQKTLASIKAGPKTSTPDDAISRVDTRASGKSRLSRIVTSMTARNKKARLEAAKLPLSDLGNDIVGWESQDDPEMPLNFPDSRKWLLLALVSSITFISPLASSMFAPAASFMSEDFHNTSTILATLAVSIFVLGYVIGPLILAPLSDVR